VLVAPFGDQLLKITRRPNNELSTQVLAHVAFAPLVLPPKGSAPPPPLVLPEPVYDPLRHTFYSDEFQRSVEALLALQRRAAPHLSAQLNTPSGGVIATLPKAVLLNVVEFCHRSLPRYLLSVCCFCLRHLTLWW
jgi:hypothetical protein